MGKTQQEQMLEQATLAALNMALRQAGQKGLKAIGKDGKVTVIKPKKKTNRILYYNIELVFASECGYIDCGYRYVVWQLSRDGIIYDCVGIYTRRDNAIRGARRFAKKEGYDKIKEIY
jgi:hypothetical protein